MIDLSGYSPSELYQLKADVESCIELKQGFFTEKKENGILYRYNRKGQLHNTQGPAVVYANGSVWYYQNGKRHRTDGPAVIHAKGRVEYLVDGRELSEEEFNQKYGQEVKI